MPDSGQFPLFYAFQLRLEGIFFCPRPRHEAFVFLPAAGAWGSAPNLLTKVPAFFKNWGTRDQQSAIQTHFTCKSQLWRRETGTEGGLTRYRPTAPDSFVRGELHGSRQPCQRGVPRLPEALFKGQNFEQKKSSPFSRKTLILAGLQGFEP